MRNTLRLIFATCLISVLTNTCLVTPTFAQESDSVRQQFREFYEPLLPRLKASYSNVRFRTAEQDTMSSEIQVTYCNGALRGAEFRFDRFPLEWFRKSDFDGKIDVQTLKSRYKPLQSPERSGGFVNDYSFEVVSSVNGTRLVTWPGEPISSLEFNPYILAPLASPRNMATFEEIMNDDAFELVDFEDRTKRDGQKVKSLFYRNHRPSEAVDRGTTIFEADFSKETGACVSLMEVEFETEAGELPEAYVIDVRYAKSSPDPDLLPPPIEFSGTLIFCAPLTVLEYDRAGVLQPDEISVAAYGFDESELGPKQSLRDNVVGGATNLLTIVAIVLVSLLVMVVGLMLVIGIFARSLKKKARLRDASEGEPTSDLSE